MAQLQLSKSHIVLGVALYFGGASGAVAQEASVIECIAKDTLVTALSLDCPYDTPERPQCSWDHTSKYLSDPVAYRATETLVQDWIDAYARERGFELSFSTSKTCPIAHQEFVDQTVIGQMLIPM